MKAPLLSLCALPLLALTPSCAVVIGNDGYVDGDYGFGDVERAVCVITGTAGNEGVSGTVTFTERAGGILVEADIRGLTPGLHGFHIHEFGDVSGLDGKSAGGHFNPDDEKHGGPEDRSRHIGDLGNLEADSTGRATYSRFDDEVRLRGRRSVIGRAIVIHADADDFTTQPTGNAGGRVGYGVIGVAKD
jgi:Cu-Zn family superoxide dismutase